MDDNYIANNIMNAGRIGKQWFPHDIYTELRSRPTLTWLEPGDIRPFWAITKHADISEISTQPDKFLSAPRSIIANRAGDRLKSASPFRSLIDMDPPDHRVYRRFVNSWFVPRNIKRLEDRMCRSAKQLVDMMAYSGNWEGDFVFDIAAIHPVRLITHLFGLPDSEEGYLIRLANEVFGTEDPEFQRGEGGKDIMKLLMESMQYFNKLLQDRKKNPTEDLASAIANAEIDGKPIGMMEAIGYYIIILTAGHETTRTAMSGGMYALLQNPAEFRKLKEKPELVDSAVEEMIRWTSPVSQFGRTAVEDYELRGVTIKAGQSVGMFYGAANRDEEVFGDPFSFRVDRNPNPHLGFGIGEHFCLGASLARLEMKVFFEEFIKRVDMGSIAQTGEVEYSSTFFVGGVKHLPMKCRITNAAS